jgi:hypothetical protein
MQMVSTLRGTELHRRWSRHVHNVQNTLPLPTCIFASHNTVRAVKSRRTEWTGYTLAPVNWRQQKTIHAQKVFQNNDQENEPLWRSSFRLDFSIEIYLLTYSMKQSPSWKANRFLASQEILRILWNSKIPAFTRAQRLSLSWASSIHSIPHIPLPADPS